MTIQRGDLQFEYDWTAIGDDDPRLTGIPDSTLLNRREGYEVLYFINKFTRKNSLTSSNDAHKIEYLIRYELPSHVRSHKNVTEWIEENWVKLNINYIAFKALK